MKNTKSDVIIVGSGVAGLYCALHLPASMNVTIITKADKEESDSFLAQGGICVLKDEKDYEAYFEDTMRAGHYENNRESVDIMISSSRDVIRDLLTYGVDFQRDGYGNLCFTREGAHSSPRILYHEDITGREITGRLLDEVRRAPNIRICDHVTMVDIIIGNTPIRHCRGVVAISSEAPEQDEDGDGIALSDGRRLFSLEAPEVVWACGGIGGLYEKSTNYSHLTGDALGIALRHKIRLKDLDYMQIHPTTLYTEKKERAFLISESVRGEGGILLNDRACRFVDELQPRDVVTKAIFAEMDRTGAKHVWLSMAEIPDESIRTHFRNIYETCLKEGYDCTKEAVPVAPAQHYYMGGVWADCDSRTSLPQLYAIGETSCNGVHGMNRLASNSLLESLVFAKRAAHAIVGEFDHVMYDPMESACMDFSVYEEPDKIFEVYRENILKAIERNKRYREQCHNASEGRQIDSASA